MPLVSVIIPTYNSAKFLSRTIGSVLGQTHQNLELIIVDDASTDGTIDVIREFTQKDLRISHAALDKNSGGPVQPTNRGLSMARGEYVAFLDHDDEWLPEKLERQVALLQASSDDVGAVVCDVALVTRAGEERSSYIFPEYPTKESALDAMLCANFFFNFSILCMRKEVLRDIGYLDERFVLGADHDYYIRIAQAYSVGVVHEPLLRYTVHQQNLSRGSLSVRNATSDLKYLLEKHRDLFLQHPRCYRHRMIHLGSALISIGQTREARIALRTAFGMNMLAPDTLFYYLISFLGKKTHHALRGLKDIFLHHDKNNF